MRLVNIIVLLLIVEVKSLAQDSLWQVNQFNEILSFSLPANFKTGQSGYTRAVAGQLNSNYYGFQYTDTVITPIEDSEIFRVSLLGFMSGRASDSTLKGYSAIVIDTSIGGTHGLMGKFTTYDTEAFYRQIYYYVTTANDRYCWFFAYSHSKKEDDYEVNVFFKSIKFDSKKVKENKFKMTSVYLKKDHL